MSDPYGQNPPSGQDPYSKPQQPNPYGSGGGYGGGPGGYGGGPGGGYGGGPGGGYGYPGGSGSEPPKTDGMSIAALVLSFLCCLAPIGVILGFVGLRRTKGGQRKGRGLAIAAIVIGIIVSLVVAGFGAAFFVFADSVVTPDNAKVGQCVNVDDEDGSVFLYKKECSEEHDAEIVGIAEVTDDNREEIESSMAGYCATAIDPDDFVKLTEYLTDLDAVIEDPKNVDVGDTLVCYVNPGEKLDKKIL